MNEDMGCETRPQYCWNCTSELWGMPGEENHFYDICLPGEHKEVECHGCGHIVVDHLGKKVPVRECDV